jgi:hypothetical protein
LPAALRRAKSLRPSCRTRSSTLAWWWTEAQQLGRRKKARRN